MRRAYFQSRAIAMHVFDSLWASNKWAHMVSRPGYHMVIYY